MNKSVVLLVNLTSTQTPILMSSSVLALLKYGAFDGNNVIIKDLDSSFLEKRGGESQRYAVYNFFPRDCWF